MQQDIYKSEKVWKVLLKTTPPVMLAQLILALYNLVDSFYIGRYSGEGLTALSVIFPMQLLITALAVGTGVGVNTLVAYYNGKSQKADAKNAAGTGGALAVLSWAAVAVLSILFLRPFAEISSNSPLVADYTVIYGSIVCIGSLPVFLESCWTKIHQAEGNMRLPMYAQLVGAVVNVILDPIMIFGMGPIPEMGVAGAAYATVIGQFCAAAIVGVRGLRRIPRLSTSSSHIRQVYQLGYPAMVMQSLYTVYIIILNAILAGFCDEAVTVLGLYYKLQMFFFIPLMALQTCIVPILSYNYARRSYDRCREIVRDSLIISISFMAVGVFCFEVIPVQVIGLFSDSPEVIDIGIVAFRWIGASFFSAALSLMFPVVFQALGSPLPSVLLSLTRQIFWGLSLIGLDYVWIAFPVAETAAGLLGLVLYRRQVADWKRMSRPVNQT